MVRYWSRQEKSRKWASPSYRATQRRNSRSGRKAINCEKTVRPWFMNHCPPPQNGILKPVAVQIAARHKSRQTADWQGLVRLRKVLYRTLVIFQVGVAPSEFLLFFVRHLQFLEVYVHVGSPVLPATAIAARNATAKAILAKRLSFHEDSTEPTTTA